MYLVLFYRRRRHPVRPWRSTKNSKYAISRYYFTRSTAPPASTLPSPSIPPSPA
ncbi:hypothetical protein KCP76_22735 [Salmonella enterica subsp. enterica serovar Weltevreden]|nr:hypothetical protein KCP76_22735 [Salmonella enterica subsp. enterica serovar Weltevreden]